MPADLSHLTGLSERISGEVIRPGDTRYARARADAIWNGAVGRRPALIVRPTSDDDVATTVRHVRDHGLHLPIRGGGHGFAGHAVADDAVMLDLSRLNRVRVDPAERRATVGAGTT